MKSVTVAVYPSSAQLSNALHMRSVITAGNSTAPPPRDMPMSISHSQQYYWTAKWQADEAVSLGEIAAGRVERFDNGREAVAWLLSENEDDA